MQWTALVLGFLAAAMLVALGSAFLSSPPTTGEDVPASGMAVIEAYACRPGETKRVTIRGVEDNYAPGNDEPATMHPRLRGLAIAFQAPPTTFDSSQDDRSVIDHFELSPNTEAAIFVMGIKPLGDSVNDGIILGDLTTKVSGTKQNEMRVHGRQIRRLIESGYWKRANDVYWASLAELPMYSRGSVLDLAQVANGPRIIDVEIGDDTVVDFIAMAMCERPVEAMGLTVRHIHEATPSADAIALFGCRALPHCDPYRGNRSCGDALPLLCYRDRGLAAPPSQSPDPSIVRTWSGGEVAATAPVVGTRFATITQANKECASQFGDGWHVAEWHLGGIGATFSATTGGRRFSGEYWIDIRNAPYGTCWKRDNDLE